MAEGLAELQATIASLNDDIEKVPRAVAKQLGAMGNDEVRTLAAHVFGSDRKFSGARRSRKARRVATSNYKITLNDVTVYPTGDPWYIFMMGRGRSNIRPNKAKALATPQGPRASAHGGRLAPRPDLLDPAIRRISEQAPKIVSDGIDEAARRSGFH